MRSKEARMSTFFTAVLVLALANAARTSDDVAELQPDWTPPPDVRENLEDVRKEMDGLQKLEALKKLKEILGIRGDLREESPRAVPPQFMMELYNTIADSEGKTLGKNPYDAKVVRSFLERDSTSSHFYIFNVSSLEPNESVLEAELHLYRKRSSPTSVHPSVLSSPHYLISVYQVLPDKSLEEPDLHRLLNVHYVGAYASGWQVFNVKQAVLSWLSGAPNLGLLVTATTIFGDHVTVDFSRRDDQPRDKQPILVLFNDDGSSSANDIVRFPVQPVRESAYEANEDEVGPEDEEDAELEDAERALEAEMTVAEGSRAKRRANEGAKREGQPELPDYVDGGRPALFPREKKDRARKEEAVDVVGEEDVEKLERDRTRNKRHGRKGQLEMPDYVNDRWSAVFQREKKDPARKGGDENDIVRAQKLRASTGFVRRKNPEQVLTSMDIYQRAMLRERLQSRKSSDAPPRLLHRDERSVPPSRTKRDSECRKVDPEPCARRELFVNFQEIGMTSIIAPEGYQAYQCRGHCKSPLSQDQKPTNHATIQGIINKMNLTPSQEVDMPCCVPAKLSSISILYLDDDSAVVLKSYTDMIVNSCGCR